MVATEVFFPSGCCCHLGFPFPLLLFPFFVFGSCLNVGSGLVRQDELRIMGWTQEINKIADQFGSAESCSIESSRFQNYKQLWSDLK